MSQAAIADDAYFVTIGIDREVYAVPVETVLEILAMRPVFRIPEAPAHLKGLIDVRGRAVAVIDLRIKLGLPEIEADQNTRIVVLDVPVHGRRLALGLVADRVFEVIALDNRQIEAPPDIGMQWKSDYIRGIGRRLDSFVVVLDLERLFSNDASHLLGAQGKRPASDGRDSPSDAAAA
jgi:purine-binding chemotaxis protein CheW